MHNLLGQMEADKMRKMKDKNKRIKMKIKKALRVRMGQEGLGERDSDSDKAFDDASRYDGIYDSEDDDSESDGGDIQRAGPPIQVPT